MRADDRDNRKLGRRGFIALGMGAFAVAAIPRLGRRPAATVRRTLPLMGTLADISVVHGEPRAASAAVDAAFAELEAVERAMTRFAGTSDVGRVNAGGTREAVRVSAATAAVLVEALAWASASDGAFDPCVGRLVELWDVARRTEPPEQRSVRRLAGRHLHRALDVGSWNGSPAVRLADRDAALDLGGIAKGYGVDRAAQALRESGMRHALVNVGGDLYAIGRAPDGGPWRVGVRSPFEPGRMVGTLEVTDEAVATSGDYLQYFDFRGRRYHHLLDPATAAPRAASMSSVTVVAASCTAADAAATTAFGMPGPEADRLLASRAPGARVALRI